MVEFQLYGLKYILIDYKIDRNKIGVYDDDKINIEEGIDDSESEKDKPNRVEYITKTLMFSTQQNEYQLIFSVEGKEKEFENLGLKSIPSLVEKAFSTIISSDENKLAKRINKGTIYIGCNIGRTTKIYFFEGIQFNEIKEIHELLSKVSYDDSTFMLYNKSLNKIESI